MTDTEQTLDLPIAHTFDIQLEGLNDHVIINALPQLGDCKKIAAVFTLIPLSIANNTAFNHFFTLATWAFWVIQSRKKFEVYYFSINISI